LSYIPEGATSMDAPSGAPERQRWWA